MSEEAKTVVTSRTWKSKRGNRRESPSNNGGRRGRGGRGGRGRQSTRKASRKSKSLTPEEREQLVKNVKKANGIVMDALLALTDEYKKVFVAPVTESSMIAKALVEKKASIDNNDLNESYGEGSLLVIDLYFPGIRKDEQDSEKKKTHEKHVDRARKLWFQYTSKVSPKQSVIIFSPAKYHNRLIPFARTGRLSIQNGVVLSRAGGRRDEDKKTGIAYFVHIHNSNVAMILRLRGTGTQTRLPLDRNEVHRLIVCSADKKQRRNFTMKASNDKIYDFPRTEDPGPSFNETLRFVIKRTVSVAKGRQRTRSGAKSRGGARGGGRMSMKAKGQRSGDMNRKIIREYIEEEESSSSSSSSASESD